MPPTHASFRTSSKGLTHTIRLACALGIAPLFNLFAMPDIVLTENGRAQTAIFVAPEVMTGNVSNCLRASVEDLAAYLRMMSGADIPVLTNPPEANDLRVPILIGAMAETVFGKPKKETPEKQGWRLVVSKKGVGLMGQSELAISYAVYEMLDRFGCRWFMPGAIGEDIPILTTLALPEFDVSDTPATINRGFLCADENFARRNRFYIPNAGHDPASNNNDVNLNPAHFRCPAHSFLSSNCPWAASFNADVSAQNNSSNTLACRSDAAANQGEITAPLPLMMRWSEELPFLFANGARVWLPKCHANFAASLPGLYLGCRLAWYPHARPKDVLDEFFNRFYGAAALPMREFWTTLDQAWFESPDHSSHAWGYLRRFTPGIMARARLALDNAATVAKTVNERARIALAETMFHRFEQFMSLRHDLAEGRLEGLETNAVAWMNACSAPDPANAPFKNFIAEGATAYFQRFLLPTYREASDLAAEYTVIAPPLRLWRWNMEADEPGERMGWPGAFFDDSDWNTTDSCVDTWSAMGIWNRPATIWYRARVAMPQIPKKTKIFLWISAVDGEARAYLNGRPLKPGKGEPHDQTEPARSIVFDLKGLAGPGQTNLLAVAVFRPTPSDPGSGGLLGPAYIFHEKITSP